MAGNNLLYAQSGGVTAVINATACGVIEQARRYKNCFSGIYAGQNGIVGVLNEALIDTQHESKQAIAALKHTPGGAFGSCRYKLKDINQDKRQYERLITVFKAHQIKYFLYNGGGDSQDTAYKLSCMSDTMGYPLQCIGIPKTIDNDLPLTDNCPGFGSAAKYVATSIREATLDVRSMAQTSTKVFIMEVMGRHAGWLAAAASLAQHHEHDAPHIILFPEVPFQQAKFLARVKQCVETQGYCVIVASEGTQTAQGQFLAQAGKTDAFGHQQLGGLAPYLAQLVQDNLSYKHHWAVLDYLQRSARHLASAVDVEQAYQLGVQAVEFAKAGKNAVLPIIKRTADAPYQWAIAEANLVDVANQEKMLPAEFITSDGFGVTERGKRYLRPLIEGEDYPPYHNGLPDYVQLKNQLLSKQLIEDFS